MLLIYNSILLLLLRGVVFVLDYFWVSYRRSFPFIIFFEVQKFLAFFVDGDVDTANVMLGAGLCLYCLVSLDFLFFFCLLFI